MPRRVAVELEVDDIYHQARGSRWCVVAAAVLNWGGSVGTILNNTEAFMEEESVGTAL